MCWTGLRQYSPHRSSPGAASALYGTDALGGVINIITRKSLKPAEVLVFTQDGEAPVTGITWIVVR